MAILKILAVDDNVPPEQLGDVHVTVIQGQTVTIQASTLMSSNPPYYHEFDKPIAGVKIVGYGQNQNNILRPSGTPIIASLTNDNQIIRLVGGNYQNGHITRLNLANGKFKVKGNTIGSDYVKFIASSWNGVAESAFSEDVGRLIINVVSADNTPPTTVGDNLIECYVGGFVTILPPVVTSETTPPYSDAQNDPPKAVKIQTLPTIGVLLYNGLECQVGQEINIEEFSLGKVKFYYNESVSAGTIDVIDFGVSDTGTGIFTY